MRANVQIYRDRKKTWRWRFIVNGRTMADSGEGYTRRRQAWRAWDHFTGHIMKHNANAGAAPSGAAYTEWTQHPTGPELFRGRGK